jgi:hypothetical protein
VLRELVDEMNRVERLVGFEPDARALAFALRNRFALEQAVGAPAVDMGEAWRFAQIYSLMWPRGADARGAGLSAYNRFSDLDPPERLLAEALFADRRALIDVTKPAWREAADGGLVADGEVILVVPERERNTMRQALLSLALEPTDLGFIHAYPRVVGAKVRRGEVHVEIELPEAP